MSWEINRRSFIKTLACGTTVTLSFSGLPLRSLSATKNNNKSGGNPAWAPIPGKANQRIEGIAKVLGQKIYARDYHARDMNGWPDTERYLYAVRTDRNNQIIDGYDLSALPPELQPLSIIDENVIARDRMSIAGGMEKPFFVKAGHAAEYCGQPVAMLIFEDFQTYRKAKQILQFNKEIIKYGNIAEKQGTTKYSPQNTYVRNDETGFNYVDVSENYDELLSEITPLIENELSSDKWTIFEREFHTQATDPMFMEPEAGLVWFDHNTGKLNLVLGTQSPSADMRNIAEIFELDKCKFKLSAIDLMACYPGGGFGGRDDSFFPRYLALCAAYSDGPLRWTYDRFEQFQVGLKRHETNFYEKIALDNEGRIKALRSKFVMNGGGRMNLSPYVADVAAMNTNNCYEIEKAISHGEATDTKDLIGGSQRGFGVPQAVIAIEALLDEAAHSLGIDPFDIRRKNLLDQNSKTITGAPILKKLQINKILDKLEKHQLWQNRTVRQQELEKSGLKYGVGLAIANQPYGNKRDGMYGSIEIGRNGSVTIHSPYIDMGNGAATALGLAPATYLGRNANHINMGEVALFNRLELSSSYEEYPNIFTHALSKFGLIEDEINGRYVKARLSASSACLSAFHQFHVVEQAALTLMLETVLPAASLIWNAELDLDSVSWQEGKLITEGRPPLSWDQIVAVIFEKGLPSLTVVHASYITEFVRMDFEFSNTDMNLPLDFIAMGSSADNLSPLDRSNFYYPPEKKERYGHSNFAPCGTLISVIIDEDSKKVKVEDCVTVLDAGRQICPEIISGQYEGGLAMAIGYVLFEDCPNTPAGPGNGEWNLDQYKIASLSDMPRKPELIILDPSEGEKTARGIAEAVMCPIPAALLNALSMATSGHRFTKLPVTENDISEVLS